MDEKRRHSHYSDWTAEDFISAYPIELDRDAVSLLSIIDCGQSGFGFEGNDLLEFVRRSVEKLVEAGAIVVTMDPSEKHGFRAVSGYNLMVQDIVNKLMAEWEELESTPSTTWRWLARPEDS